MTVTSEDDMITTIDDLRKFYDELSQHDWFFDYSDDGRVWDEGRRERDRIVGKMAQSPDFKELYYRFADWIYRRTETKPPRP